MNIDLPPLKTFSKKTMPDDAPWTEFGDWKDGRIRSNASQHLLVFLLVGLSFIAAGVPAILGMPEDLSKGEYGFMIMLIFPLAGLAVLSIFIYKVIGLLRFGRIELVLDPAPGSLGGDFGAYIDLPVPYDRELEITVVLSNLHSIMRRSSNGGKRKNTRLLWSEEGLATLTPTDNGLRCAFRFAVPEDTTPSTPPSNNYNHWLLEINCPLKGVDLNRGFDVPVVDTDAPLHSSMKIDYAREFNPLQHAPKDQVDISETSDGLRFFQPRFRDMKTALGFSGIGIIFTPIGFLIGGLFGLLFTGIGLLLIGVAIFKTFSTVTTTINRREVSIVRNFFGKTYPKTIRSDDIRTIESVLKSSTNVGSRYHAYYSLIAHLHDGTTATLTEDLDGIRLADYVENRVLRALGIQKTRKVPKPGVSSEGLSDADFDME